MKRQRALYFVEEIVYSRVRLVRGGAKGVTLAHQVLGFHDGGGVRLQKDGQVRVDQFVVQAASMAFVKNLIPLDRFFTSSSLINLWSHGPSERVRNQPCPVTHP